MALFFFLRMTARHRQGGRPSRCYICIGERDVHLIEKKEKEREESPRITEEKDSLLVSA